MPSGEKWAVLSMTAHRQVPYNKAKEDTPRAWGPGSALLAMRMLFDAGNHLKPLCIGSRWLRKAYTEGACVSDDFYRLDGGVLPEGAGSAVFIGYGTINKEKNKAVRLRSPGRVAPEGIL